MTEDTETTTMDELSVLKSRARLMGITFSNNIGLEALRTKIKEKQEGVQSQEAQPNPLDDEAPVEEKPLTPAQVRTKMIADQMKLVRLRITNLDPKKKELPGEIFTVANDIIGTVRKYVPYGEVTEDGWHVPFIIYTALKERKFLNIRTTKGPNGQPIIRQGWAPEFSLEVLPQLTPVEIEKLATAQKAAGVFVNEDQF